MKTVKLKQLKRLRVPATNGEAVRLDLGSGPNGKPGFLHVDSIAFPGVDKVVNLAEPIYVPLHRGFEDLAECFERKITGYKPWPWKNDSIEEIHSSHCLEHFTAMERIHFVNEMWRVLKVGAKATVITPHWASCRAYGDPTHKWSPISEFTFFYYKKEWRMSQAPHTDLSNMLNGLKCNFEVTGGFSLHPDVAVRNQEYQQFAIGNYKESCQDTWSTFVKLP